MAIEELQNATKKPMFVAAEQCRDPNTELTSLARDIVGLASHSFVANLPVADQIESAFVGFDIARVD